ncbi:hypothetical protein Tco_1098313 [Tanacetum coccineum]
MATLMERAIGVIRLLNIMTRNNWAKHRLQRIMMNSKGIPFVFKFDSRLVRCCSEGHDVPIQVLKMMGRSSFARCLIEVNSEADLVDVVTIGIPSLSRIDFLTKEKNHPVEYE